MPSSKGEWASVALISSIFGKIGGDGNFPLVKTIIIADERGLVWLSRVKNGLWNLCVFALSEINRAPPSLGFYRCQPHTSLSIYYSKYNIGWVRNRLFTHFGLIIMTTNPRNYFWRGLASSRNKNLSNAKCNSNAGTRNSFWKCLVLLIHFTGFLFVLDKWKT